MLFSELSPQVHFLSDAAHLLATASPETSAFLMSRRNELLVENDITIPETQRQHVCSCCGHIMIPGKGSILKIETGKACRLKTKKQQRQPRNTSKTAVVVPPAEKRSQPAGVSKVMTCGNCGKNSRLKLDGPNRISRPKKLAQQSATQQKQVQVPEPARLSANANSKKRAKNRKAGLQALLDQKQGSTASGFGLSLSDFMMK